MHDLAVLTDRRLLPMRRTSRNTYFLTAMSAGGETPALFDYAGRLGIAGKRLVPSGGTEEQTKDAGSISARVPLGVRGW